MLANVFTFPISVSEQNYEDKLQRHDNRWATLRFQPQQISVRTLLDYATQGKVFCASFKSTTDDGSFGTSGKDKEHYTSTSAFFFDIDGADRTMDRFISNLNFKPSFAYTTFSNSTDEHRFRLGYVFRHPVIGFDKSEEMYNAIAAANGFTNQEWFDKRNCVQCFFGTLPSADTYKSDYIYSHYDFDDYVVHTSPMASAPITVSASTDIDKTFLQDFNDMPFDDFFSKYKEQYYRDYWLAAQPELILDESQMFYTFPDSYHAVIHKCRGRKTLKWGVGDNRKSKIFVTTQIMLANNPSLSIEALLYGLRVEREWYYINFDNKISNDVLIEKATYAMTHRYPTTETKHPLFRLNKVFWEEQGVKPIQAVNYVRKELRLRKIRLLYNPGLTNKENVKLMNDNGIKICVRTLQRMVTGGDIQIIDNPKGNSTILLDCHRGVTNPMTQSIIQLISDNDTITQKEISVLLNINIRTVKRHIEDLKKQSVLVRIGNNRSGSWKLMC